MDRRRGVERIPARSGRVPRQYVAFEQAAGAGERDPGGADRYHQRFEFGHDRRRGRLRLVALLKLEPVETVRRQRDHVGQFADRREMRAPEHFQRHAFPEGRKVELGRLSRARKVGDAENDLLAELPHIGQHRAVGGADEGQAAAPEGERRFADRDQFLGGAEQRRQAARLRLDIDRLIAIDRSMMIGA